MIGKKLLIITVLTQLLFSYAIMAQDQPPPIPCRIFAIAGENGTISPSGRIDLSPGSNQTFRITPNKGYHIFNLEVIMAGETAAKQIKPPVLEYTFKDLTPGFYLISASFEINTYTISATSGPNGRISPSGDISVTYGKSQEFLLEPDPHNHVLNLLIDDISLGPLNRYSFDSVESDHTIHAVFEPDIYSISVRSSENGSIIPAKDSGQPVPPPPDDYIPPPPNGYGEIKAYYGLDKKILVVPETGYHIMDVIIDGVSYGALKEYTFTEITTNHTISAIFEADRFVISASPGVNGSVIPFGEIKVPYGEDYTFVITPNTGYYTKDIIVDGKSAGAKTEYTFAKVAGKHTISAVFEIKSYPISARQADNGVIKPSGEIMVNHGANLTYKIEPNQGYHIADVLIDGVSAGVIREYTFASVVTGHTISAIFEIDRFTILARADNYGSIAPSGAVSVNYGSDQSFAIKPGPGYQISNLIIDGVYHGFLAEYTFTNVTSDHTIYATFVVDKYIITAAPGMHGSINPFGEIKVSHGADYTFKITPNNGYSIKDVIVDGKPIGAMPEYAFVKVMSNHTISAVFEIKSYPISAIQKDNGIITPPGETIVNYGKSLTFTITPNQGYHIADVIIDGVSVGVMKEYTFDNVRTVHTISAVFEIDIYTILAKSEEHGTITPSGSVPVSYGSDQLFTIETNQGYRVSDLIVDGVSKGPINKFVFENVTSMHTISAEISEDCAKGDVNGDGHIRSDDAILALRMSVGLRTPTPEEFCRADINNNGRIDSADSILIIRKASGLEIPNKKNSVLVEQDSIETYKKLVMEDSKIYIYSLIGENRRNLLMQNYPNPFNPETWIPYQLINDSNVIIQIYNVDGSVIKKLDLGYKLAGAYIAKDKAAYWSGRDELNMPVSSGVYFYSIWAGEFFDMKKMIVLD